MKIKNLFLSLFLFALYKAPTVVFKKGIAGGEVGTTTEYTPEEWQGFVEDQRAGRIELCTRLVEMGLVDPYLIPATNLLFGTSQEIQPAEPDEIVRVDFVIGGSIKITENEVGLKYNFSTEIGFTELLLKRSPGPLLRVHYNECCKIFFKTYLESEADLKLMEITFYRESDKEKLEIPICESSFDEAFFDFFESNAVALTNKLLEVCDPFKGVTGYSVLVGYRVFLSKQAGRPFEPATYGLNIGTAHPIDRDAIANVINMLKLNHKDYPDLIFLPEVTPEEAHEIFRTWYNT